MGEQLRKTIRWSIIAVFLFFLWLFVSELSGSSFFPAEAFDFSGLFVFVAFFIFAVAFALD